MSNIEDKELSELLKGVEIEKDNLSEEEIIKNIKHYLNITEYHRKQEYENFGSYIQGLLDLYYNEKEKVDRLQKENEELKEMLKTRIRYTNELEQDLFENASNYVVSKDKIKDKIKELEEQCKTELLTTWLETKIEVLEDLLKEN